MNEIRIRILFQRSFCRFSPTSSHKALVLPGRLLAGMGAFFRSGRMNPHTRVSRSLVFYVLSISFSATAEFSGQDDLFYAA